MQGGALVTSPALLPQPPQLQMRGPVCRPATHSQVRPTPAAAAGPAAGKRRCRLAAVAAATPGLSGAERHRGPVQRRRRRPARALQERRRVGGWLSHLDTDEALDTPAIFGTGPGNGLPVKCLAAGCLSGA